MKRKFSIIGLLFLSISLLSFEQDFDLKASITRGKSIYETQCVSCHQMAGEGIVSVFPPPSKSNNLKDKNRLVKVLLKGVRGTIKVNEVEYNGEMMAYPLTDTQASDVLNYIRNAWGNKGEPILPKEIQPALKTQTVGYRPY